MGMIWRPTMTLLTTLAALVIIVNCVEEDSEADYRREIRPRNLDTGTLNYDQSWRAIEEQEQDPQKPQNAESFDVNSPEGAPKRRRPGRKRKRRPHTPLNEETNLKEVPYNNEPPRSYHDVDFENFRQTTQMPRRRRKRPEVRPVRWTDDDVMIVDRPVQNNGGRRKNRLKLETFPVLSEFSNIGQLGQEKIETETETNTHEILAEQVFGHNREHRTSGIKNYHVAADVDAVEDTDQISKASITADRSLSEFSMELIPKPKEEVNLTPANVKPTTNTPETTTVTERAKSQTYDVYKLHEFENSEPEHQQPIPNKRVRLLKSKKKKDRTEQKEQDKALEKTDSQDQLTLKDILKRSNGTSLSEILQKHNLSLSDLLHGKEHAVSLLKSKDALNSNLFAKNISTEDTKEELDTKDSSEQPPINIISNYDIQPASKIRTETVQVDSEPETTPTTTVKTLKDNEPKVLTNRRFPMNLRKTLRIRPIQNATNVFRGQLNRDLLTVNTRKYSNFRRNITKSRQWSDIIPQIIHNNTNKENKNKTSPVKTTTEVIPEETTISIEVANQNGSYENMHLQINADTTLDDIDMDITESAVAETVTETAKNFTEKRVGIVSMPRPTAISSGLRRQALNNRLKKKRIKNKNSATEPPQDDIIKHLFGMGNLVSSSEFIARTEGPQIMEDDSTELSTLDIITTERFSRTEGHVEITSTQTTTQQVIVETTTEEPAKIEIEEIFSDAEARTKLSRILKERNMTLNELVALRERGSSNLHLADIFHNASREPNPAEPFLSKSLLEPISKETYPLRAILEANLHDTNGRITTTIDSNVNIPVVMDFRNNVNENTENIGISSLLNNFSKNITESTSTDLEDRNFTMQSDSIIKNTSQVRESRVLDKISDDVVSWNEIFSLMGKSRNEGIEESSSGDPFKKLLIEDPDGDRLIVLEDLQHLTDLDNNIASVPKEKLDVKTNTVEKEAGVPEKVPSHTKSVTVATASIAGLAMVLFLLTYATYKWRQQKSLMRKRSFCADRIPTPVFENRKGHKNNSSTRSVSPMLQTSNIYTLNTLDSHNGKESPDYMWDSLRKPFQ